MALEGTKVSNDFRPKINCDTEYGASSAFERKLLQSTGRCEIYVNRIPARANTLETVIKRDRGHRSV